LPTIFQTFEDPRIERTKDHLLIDILTIAILAVICGADGWVAITDHAPENVSRLRHLALSALNQEKSAKLGAKNKRLRAGGDDNYLFKVLSGR
jgi:hypothetical protein